MRTLFPLLPAVLLAGAGMLGLCRGINVFDALTRGAAEGIRLLGRLLPPLAVLLPAVYMLRASGAVDALTAALSPLLLRLGIPAETVGLMLLRPLSGSAALAVGGELMTRAGPDSLVGRTAAVMLGSTETTLYVLTVYFGAAGIRRTRHALPAALCADLAGFLTAAWCVRGMG